MTTLGEALAAALEQNGVDTVFGIPGVHTIELYRGLAAGKIRHVTPRHEQGAGFMADGYARVTGRPGVAFVITGPGLTNTLTAMGQARADSIPMLVVSGVNALGTLGKGLGYLHELPDQRGMAATVALSSDRIEQAADLGPVLARVFDAFAVARPGPRHIEVPLDVMTLPAALPGPRPAPAPIRAAPGAVRDAAARLAAAARPLILAGGGARGADQALTALAERLGAPVVLTVNARGLLHAHPLAVPASPSLEPVRDLVRSADLVLAIGTEFGPTDYDMYGVGGFPMPKALIRIDICPDQIARHPCEMALVGEAAETLAALLGKLPAGSGASDGARRAEATRAAAFAALEPGLQAQVRILESIREAVPGAILVGDSTQVIYAGNLYYDHDRPGGWFNAATGFGALGYGIPAAIGAALGQPSAPVLCLCGDGGAQFSLPELMTAAQERLPVIFLFWNNRAYLEIANAMAGSGVPVLGCHPTPPDFELVARSCGLPFFRAAMTPEAVATALRAAQRETGPTMIEIDAGGA